VVVEQKSTRAELGEGVEINEVVVPINDPSQEWCNPLLVQDHGMYVISFLETCDVESWVYTLLYILNSI